MTLRQTVISTVGAAAFAVTALAPLSPTKAQTQDQVFSPQAVATLNWINPDTLLPRSVDDVDPRLRPRYRELLDTIEALDPAVRREFFTLARTLDGFSTPQAVTLFQNHPETVILGSNISVFNGMNNQFRFPQGVSHIPMLDPKDPHNKGRLFEILDFASEELGLKLPPRDTLTTIEGRDVVPNPPVIHALLEKVTENFRKNGIHVSTDHTLPMGPIGGFLSMPPNTNCGIVGEKPNCNLALPAAPEAHQLINLLAFGIFQKQLFTKLTNEGKSPSYSSTKMKNLGLRWDMCTFQSPQFMPSHPDMRQAPDTYGTPATNTTKRVLSTWLGKVADPTLEPTAPQNRGRILNCFSAMVPKR
jgi:hypothetical protein